MKYLNHLSLLFACLFAFSEYIVSQSIVPDATNQVVDCEEQLQGRINLYNHYQEKCDKLQNQANAEAPYVLDESLSCTEALKECEQNIKDIRAKYQALELKQQQQQITHPISQGTTPTTSVKKTTAAEQKPMKKAAKRPRIPVKKTTASSKMPTKAKDSSITTAKPNGTGTPTRATASQIAKPAVSAPLPPQTASYREFIKGLVHSHKGSFYFTYNHPDINNSFDVYIVDLSQDDIVFYWKDQKKQLYRNFGNLSKDLEAQGKTLKFAMNGGIFTPKMTPEGLYIERGKELSPINLRAGRGNFYLKPNGVFYIHKSRNANIMETATFQQYRPQMKDIVFAVQSGPMLVQEGKVHDAFRQGSTNLHIRNGVGILDSQHIVFIISKKPVNLYDFATLFRNYFSCDNALYLDGAISEMFVPQDRERLRGNFTTIIGVVPSGIND